MLSIRFRRLIYWTAKQRSVLYHSREHACTALNSSGSMLSNGAFDAAWLQLLGHKDPIHGQTAGRLDAGCSSYVLSCFQFNIIPLWNVWHSGNGLIFLHRWILSWYHARIQWAWPIISQMFVEAVCVSARIITCGCRSGLWSDIWFKIFGEVSHSAF